MKSEVSVKMNIPTKLSVGYKKKDDTYSGKLAYVIYTDAKGVLRKETSWNGWRDKKLGVDEYENVPTSGFVLNKKVGGTRSGWNHRQEKVRVFDPRGFEFEIPVSNLLFILQETNSIKGKGLEGEFVYSWDGSDMVLLPVDCEEYRSCAAFTEKQSQKMDKNEMIEGHIYLMKDMSEVMYLGKHPYAEKKGYSKPHRFKPVGSRHIFLKLGEKETEYSSKYLALTGYVKIAERKSSEVSPDFANAYTSYVKSSYCTKATELKVVKKSITKSEADDAYYYGMHFIMKEEDKSFVYYLERSGSYYRDELNLYKGPEIEPSLKDGTFSIPKVNKTDKNIVNTLRKDQLNTLSAYTVIVSTDKNTNYDMMRDSRY